MSDYKIVKIFDESSVVEEEINETPINTFKVGNVIKLKDNVKDIYNKDFPKSMFNIVLVVTGIRGLNNDILMLSTSLNGPKMGFVNFTNVEFIAEKLDPEVETKVIRFPKYICSVIADETNVYAAAGSQYKVVKVVKKYDLYTVIDEKDGWAKLKIGGWIKLEDIRKVKAL